MVEMEDDVANGEEKGQRATSSNPGLQVSVSFGRFENDSLSWEKFSAFSPNKYLEEVEKCKTPGSVAQKKAYFEAHYKKIAERKAELMDQEKQMEKKAPFRLSGHNQGDVGGEPGGSMAECDVNDGSYGQCTDEEDKHVIDIAAELDKSCVDEPNEEPVIVKECQTSIDGMPEECGDVLVLDSPKLEKLEEVVRMEEKPEEAVLVVEEEEEKEVKEEISAKDFVGTHEMPMEETKKEKDGNLTKAKYGSARMNRARGSPKANPVNNKPMASKPVMNRKTPPSKDRSMAMAAKKPESPVPKARVYSTPKVSKTASKLTSMSSSRPSVKKENVPTSQRNKQTAPKSLHMSLSLGPSGSDPTALATTRKSLIMERMGDKDIVKRAFKTFQKSFDQLNSSTDGKKTAPKQVPAKTSSVSALTTPRKEKDRPVKVGSKEKKNVGAQSFGLKSTETAEKQKELSKSSREKSGARTVERTRLLAKPKAGSTDVKTQRHSLDPNSKTIQGSLPVPTLSKGSSDKDGSTK
ncbi:PREDICTED: protein WVD2-like 7 isoform X2 [Tarenaya hassleriana]|uniref:protein WVD2-like 7 isoform X2 n=1 Tax=Tarenaya hassleriana TaxID=28532 RepID=UPI00053C9DC4|nr:PREDICTED: protein WVD2-like 7 isoform X2 [Tarenaya hassleriana]